jgi:hypothetical protein
VGGGGSLCDSEKGWAVGREKKSEEREEGLEK